MKHILISIAAGAVMISPALAQDLPPADAKAGECYAKVLIPASYQNSPQEVIVSPAKKNFTKIPAVYNDIAKRVLIEEESHELEIIPATYEIVEKTVLIKPEQVIKTMVPAEYRAEEKQILISPARVEWKKGNGAHEKIDSATGEIMCRVEIPAQYDTVSQQVLIKASQTTEEIIPAKYETIKVRVMKTPPSTQKIVIPAKYEDITIKEIVEPEQFQITTVPATYATVNKRQLISSESIQWRQILCETNTTPKLVLKIQNALVNAGYSIGVAPNGNFGPATKAAIRKFQQNKGLPTGGLTMSTIKSLGLEI